MSNNVAKLCMQCRDEISGQIGTFMAEMGDGKRAVSPVFPDFMGLSAWAKSHGYVLDVHTAGYPCGVYRRPDLAVAA